MSSPALAALANTPLKVGLLNLAAKHSLSFAAVASVFAQAQRLLPGARLQVQCLEIDDLQRLPLSALSFGLCLVLADAELADELDDTSDANTAANALGRVWQVCQQAQCWGVTGAAILSAAQAALLKGVQVALPLNLQNELDTSAYVGVQELDVSLNLYALDQPVLSCCGGAANLDFSLALVEAIYGPQLQARIMETLCIEEVRAGNRKQQAAAFARSLPPKLTEVLALMQANIEEPLSSDDLAGLVNISRRQLERLFKQYLGNLPSRYYLEMRLGLARKLLVESHHSIVQIGLMCGFSSGSHFSTAFSALFNMTPREERQRKLKE